MMTSILAQFTDDGRTGAVPYSLSIIEKPRCLDRYVVQARLLHRDHELWSASFTTFQAAADRWIDELRVMAQDYDNHPWWPK